MEEGGEVAGLRGIRPAPAHEILGRLLLAGNIEKIGAMEAGYPALGRSHNASTYRIAVLCALRHSRVT